MMLIILPCTGQLLQQNIHPKTVPRERHPALHGSVSLKSRVEGKEMIPGRKWIIIQACKVVKRPST